jgi:cell wall-associated NlpC family hydrolase
VTLLITFGNRLHRIGIVALTALLLLTFFSQPVHADDDAITQEASVKPLSFVDRTSRMAIEALSLIGIHYKRGGNNPEHGLDCSGLVRYVFKESNGKELPRTSAEISKVGERVEKEDLQPGDLVFFKTLKHAFSHVGIYLGDNKFVHAPAAGGKVRIESMDLQYWKKRFNGARRIEENNEQQNK